MGKKGNSGIASLFILIAVLLIAVIFSVLYIKYSQGMKNQAGTLFQRAQSEASSALIILEIAGTDGRDGHLTNFTQMLRVLPGSTEVRLESCSLMVSKGSDRITLNYREGDSVFGNTGYNTWLPQELGTLTIGAWHQLEEDLDDDQEDDYVRVNTSHVLFNISGTDSNLSIFPLNYQNASLNLALGNQVVNNAGYIQEQGTIFGSFTLSGLNPNTTVLDASINFTVTPRRIDEGYYTVDYLARSGTPVDNVLLEGDTILITFQGLGRVYSDEFMTFNYICPVIVPIEKTIYTGTTLPKQNKVILFPSI